MVCQVKANGGSTNLVKCSQSVTTKNEWRNYYILPVQQ